jgi:SAM-dependent methyltransferase
MHPNTLLTCLAATLALAGTAATAQEEVPFITTPDRVTLAMLDLAGVGADDSLLDLGSGDGRIVITAARRHGARAMGVEIVPDLVDRSRVAAQKAGVAARTEFLVQDLFKTDLTAATVITMYLLPEVNLQLRPSLLKLQPGTRIVSHDWDMGDWPPDRTLTLEVPEKAIGREKRSRVHLWWVPAPVAGLWCGPAGQRLRLEQRFQSVLGRLDAGPVSSSVQGQVSGKSLMLQGLNSALQLEWAGPGQMRLVQASGPWSQGAMRRVWSQAGPADTCPSEG